MKIRVFAAAFGLMLAAVFIYDAIRRLSNRLPSVDDQMNIAEVFRTFSNTPIEDATGPVSKRLANLDVFVVTAVMFAGAPGEKLRLAVAHDKYGDTWAYCYTGESELLVSNPPGSYYAKVSFPDFFRMISRDPQFRGICVNSGSNDSFVIPREVFQLVVTD